MLGIFRDDEMDFKESKTVDELMTETEDFVINPEGESMPLDEVVPFEVMT